MSKKASDNCIIGTALFTRQDSLGTCSFLAVDETVTMFCARRKVVWHEILNVQRKGARYVTASGKNPSNQPSKEKIKVWPLLKKLFGVIGNLKWYLFLAVAFAITLSVVTVIQADLLARLVDAMLSQNPAALRQASIAAISLELAAIAFVSMQHGSIGYFVHSSVERINAKAAQRIARAQAAYISGEHSGQILSRLTSDLNRVQSLLQANLLSLISGVLTAGLALGYMFYKNWLLTIVVVGVSPLAFVIANKLTGPLAALSQESQQALGEINVIMEESVSGAAILRVFGLGEYLSSRFREYNQLWREKQVRSNVFVGLMNSVGFVSGFLPFLLVFGIGGVLMLRGQISLGVLLAFITLLNFISFPLQELPATLGQIASNSAALSRVFEVLELPTEREDGEALEFDEKAPVVEFRNVTFSYPESGVPALKDVSFAVNRGEKIAFAGSSGSGKSTILRLILGEYDPDEGQVLVGGHDVREWSLTSLRAHFAKVSQDTYLFPYSVMENLTLGLEDVPVEEVIRAAEVCCAHEFIEGLPEGYNTLVGEMGGRLSGGERQRLSLARAILRGPEILLLDEATSALDYDIEHKVLENLMEALPDVTMMIVAHRLSTIVGADRIYVLENGSIVESGTHSRLMEAKGRYASLYAKEVANQTAAHYSDSADGFETKETGEVHGL